MGSLVLNYELKALARIIFITRSWFTNYFIKPTLQREIFICTMITSYILEDARKLLKNQLLRREKNPIKGKKMVTNEKMKKSSRTCHKPQQYHQTWHCLPPFESAAQFPELPLYNPWKE